LRQGFVESLEIRQRRLPRGDVPAIEIAQIFLAMPCGDAKRLRRTGEKGWLSMSICRSIPLNRPWR
jgi:hypothetical protein